jgi:hypothetical protein
MKQIKGAPKGGFKKHPEKPNLKYQPWTRYERNWRDKGQDKWVATQYRSASFKPAPPDLRPLSVCSTVRKFSSRSIP